MRLRLADDGMVASGYFIKATSQGSSDVVPNDYDRPGPTFLQNVTDVVVPATDQNVLAYAATGSSAARPIQGKDARIHEPHTTAAEAFQQRDFCGNARGIGAIAGLE